MVKTCNETSIQNKQISFFAIIEIVLAIALYWGFAMVFDTYYHLLVSIAVVPLLLLKSPQSVRYALQALTKTIAYKKELSTKYKIALIILSYLISLSITYSFTLMFTKYLNTFLSQLIFGLTLGGIVVTVVGGVIVGVIGQRVASIGVSAIGAGVGAGAVLGVLLVKEIVILEAVLAGLLVGLLAGLLATVILLSNEDNKNIFFESINNFIASFFFLGAVLGMLLTVTTLKIFSTIKYIRYGLRNVEKNYIENNLYIDMKKTVEIMPDAEKCDFLNNQFKLSKIKSLDSNNNYNDILFQFFAYIIMYPVAFFIVYL